MASSYTCDGCKLTVVEPTKVGHVLPRDYCATCAELAQQFIEAEQKEREMVHSAFQSKREKLIKKFGANGFLLPDVIHAE